MRINIVLPIPLASLYASIQIHTIHHRWRIKRIASPEVLDLAFADVALKAVGARVSAAPDKAGRWRGSRPTVME